MSTCGLLNFDPKSGAATGKVSTLQFRFTLRLDPTDNDPTKPGYKPDHPTHTVYVEGAHGGFVEVGSAWRKIGERGDIAGKPFFSFTVDDPSMEKPLNLFAFPSKHTPPQKDMPVPYDVVWRRERGAAAA